MKPTTLKSPKSVIVHSLFTQFDIDLFKGGKHFKLYEKLGAHNIELNGVKGVYFAVSRHDSGKQSAKAKGERARCRG